jgi:hypothetical protein
MVIEPLLWYCLDHGTSVEEQGIGLSIARRSSETVLCFRTDSQEFRARFYERGGPQLVFVELKGADLGHALDQLKQTIGAVKPGIEKAVRGSTQYLALVVSDGAVPKTRASDQRDFESMTRVRLHVQSTARGKRAVDLRAVLQSVHALAPFVAD